MKQFIFILIVVGLNLLILDQYAEHIANKVINKIKDNKK